MTNTREIWIASYTPTKTLSSLASALKISRSALTAKVRTHEIQPSHDPNLRLTQIEVLKEAAAIDPIEVVILCDEAIASDLGLGPGWAECAPTVWIMGFDGRRGSAKMLGRWLGLI